MDNLQPPPRSRHRDVFAKPLTMLRKNLLHYTKQDTSRMLKAEVSTSYYKIPLREDLKEIRVIKLIPGKWEDEIACELSTISLSQEESEHSAYETLSYVWEGEEGFAILHLNGKRTQITRNLWLALRRLRMRRDARTLWVDALCIDQKNDAEKSHQVGLMGEVYEHCKRVFLWMGDYSDDQDCQTIEDTVDMTWEEKKEILENNKHNRGFDAFNFIHELSQNKHFDQLACARVDAQGLRFDGKALEPFKELMQKPWWERIWIVQEVLLPRSAVAIYGANTISWTTFSNAVVPLANHTNRCCEPLIHYFDHITWSSVQRFRREMKAFTSTKSHIKKGEPIGVLLWRFRVRKATEGRDMVYGLLGLAKKMPFEPDFSLTKAEVYKQITLLSIERQRDLSILEGMRWSQSEMPSWLYDWSFPMERRAWQSAYARLRSSYMYNTSLETCPVMSTPDASTLALGGIFFDKVIYVDTTNISHKASRNNIGFGEFQRLMNELLDICHSWYCKNGENQDLTQKPYIGGRTWRRAFWRTLCQGLVYWDVTDEKAKNRGRNVVPFGEDSERKCEAFWPLPADTKYFDKKKEAGMMSFLDRIATVTYNRSFFLTEKGYMGFGTPKIGDEVWVLYGGDLPFLLRKREGEEELTYEMVGDCYVQGIMDGEAMLETDANEKTVLLT